MRHVCDTCDNMQYMRYMQLHAITCDYTTHPPLYFHRAYDNVETLDHQFPLHLIEKIIDYAGEKFLSGFAGVLKVPNDFQEHVTTIDFANSGYTFFYL